MASQTSYEPNTGSRGLLSMPHGDHVNMSEMERMLSVVGGTALALYGLSRLSLPSMILLGGGLYAVYRGARGHCHVYDQLGIDHGEQ